MLTLFPFERRFYDEHGIAARYVGHPLADLVPSRSDRDGARSTLGLHRSAPVVALLPGSRLSEVSRLAAPMLRAGSWLRRRRPDIRFVAPLANRETRQCFESVIAGEGANLDVRIVDGHSLTAMAASDVVLLASGTATLEAMLVNRPMVITYRTMALTWMIGHRMLDVDDVGLPNLLAGRRIVPELLQDQASPERLGAAVLRILEDAKLRSRLHEEFDSLRGALQNNADARAAEAVLEVAAA